MIIEICVPIGSNLSDFRSREPSNVERNRQFNSPYDERIKPDGFGNIPFQHVHNHQRHQNGHQQEQARHQYVQQQEDLQQQQTQQQQRTQEQQRAQQQKQTQQQQRTQEQHEEQLRQKIQEMTVQPSSNKKHEPSGISSRPRRIMRGRGKQIKTT